MPVLRRPDDHRRNLRRRAPCALAIADPDQDRHLMTDRRASRLATPYRLRLQPRAGAGTRCPHDLRRLSPAAAPTPAARILAPEKARRLRSRRQHWPPPAPAATWAIRPRPPNPHRSRPAKQRPSSPRFPPYEAFGRRPRAQPHRPAKGRRPKPSYEGPEVNRQLLVSVNSDLSDRVNSLPTSYPVGSCDP